VTTAGLVAKTGWAIAVVVEGTAAEPVIVDRRLLDLLPPGLPGNVFHVAGELDAADAERLVAQVRRAADEGATRAMAELIATYGVRVVAVVAASGQVPGEVAAILKSHALVHAAEGELVRDALAEAAATAGVPVVRTRRKELLATAERVLGIDAETVRAQLAALGRPIGPPWRQEHKDAALAAWIALAG